MFIKKWYIYILASEKNWTLYVWSTSNISQRIVQHKNKLVEWFTKKYNVINLVYYEYFDDINEAIKRERQIKRWKREWKLNLIEWVNIEWKDLSHELSEQ